MTAILEALKALVQIVPLIIELIKMFQGQPKEVRAEAVHEAKRAARERCELGSGVGCPSGVKQ